MNATIQLGKINTLQIARDTDFGFFLVPSDSKEQIISRSDTEEYEVLLPNAYIKDDMNIDDMNNNEMSVHDMSINAIGVHDMNVDDMSVYGMSDDACVSMI